VGNFGGGRFFGYTAYGDTINVAARLEAANKQLGTRICVSATLADKVQGFRGRPIGDLILRGKTEPLRAFEPLGLNEKGQNDKLKNVAIQNALANSPSLRPKLSPTPSQSCQ
jgi:class 3 adenylate cyclase